jgi:hypothetical protein
MRHRSGGVGNDGKGTTANDRFRAFAAPGPEAGIRTKAAREWQPFVDRRREKVLRNRLAVMLAPPLGLGHMDR